MAVSTPPGTRPVLFAAAGWRAIELEPSDLPALQAFFQANPEYFHAVNGATPRPDEAQQEFFDRPPAHMPYERAWMIGWFDGGGQMLATAGGLSNFIADGVWHIGLFIVATALHGGGQAGSMIEALERWMAGQGARFSRLGVVAGNRRAERFWEKAGYREVRRREGVQAGRQVNTVRVMVKWLDGQGLDDYLQRVERDRPESTSP